MDALATLGLVILGVFLVPTAFGLAMVLTVWVVKRLGV